MIIDNSLIVEREKERLGVRFYGERPSERERHSKFGFSFFGSSPLAVIRENFFFPFNF